jgi:hypothetical protein
MWSAWFLLAFFIVCTTIGWQRYRATRQRIYLIPAGATLAAAALVLCMALRLI